LQRRVALKVMKPLLAADPSARQRFLREARATAALEHEHIIAIHHIDEANGVPYLAMPLLQGETLDDRLRRENVLPLGEVLRIGRQTAEGLAAAHEKGLIHRDIKPGNVWLEAPSGRVKILDFGLAAMACPEGEKTLPGTILGTPGYMAPEQTEGQADCRADLFSLGCVLYRMATGRSPFKGQTMVEKMRSTLFDPVQPPQQVNPALPGPLCHLIQRLLARNPEERPATAPVVARVLETLEKQARGGVPAKAGVPVAVAIPVAVARPAADATVPVAAVAVPAGRPPLDRRWLLLGGCIGGGLLLLLVLLVVLLAFSGRRPAATEGPGTDGDAGRGEGAVARPRAQARKRAPLEAVVPAVEVTPDRTFPETWVTKPQPIEGLKSWCIETNDVGQYFPAGFDFTTDEQLLIRYRQYPNNGSAPWMRFDPKVGGLAQAPFDGSYDALTGDARMCARCVSGGVQLWEQGAPTQSNTLRSPGPRYAAAFSPNGKSLVTLNMPGDGSSSNDLRFWDAHEGSKLGICPLSDYVSAGIMGWSPNSSTLAGGAGNAIILLRAPWDKEAGRIVRPSAVKALSWSPDGKYLATLETGDQVHVLDVAAGKAVVDVAEPKNVVTLPAWSPDGKELAFGTGDRKVVVWNLEEKKVTYTFTGHTRPLNAVAYLGDGKTLISGSGGSVRFWDLEKNAFRGTLLNLAGQGWLAISPEGNYRCSPGGESRFVFKVREDNNRVREFAPEVFHNVYGWQNHPERVRLTGE
jgi:hypothetical protein